MFYRLLNMLVDVRIPVDTGDFRLMTRQVVDELQKLPEAHRFIRGMVAWIGFDQQPLLYDRDPRFAGETKYGLFKMIKLAVDAATSFSIVPLRLATYLALLFLVFAAIGIGYAILSFFVGYSVPGWTSVLIIMLAIGGVQLLILGIMGEYLGRMYMQNKGRSLYIVKTVIAKPRVQPTDDAAEPDLRRPVPAQLPSLPRPGVLETSN